MSNFEVSTAQVAYFFDVSDRTVRYWHANGCPQVRHGVWNLKVVFDWWWDNIGADRAAAACGDESTNESKRLYWFERAKGEALKNQRLKGEVVSWSEIDPVWAGRVSEVTSALESLKDRLPPVLEGKPLAEIRRTVRDELSTITANYARDGRFTPAPGKKSI